ncbi:MAG TPA: flagellin, partial [Deltaproteobacteria bacterium]|nr:flagellin [Deltaproteobacteria bacterium]
KIKEDSNMALRINTNVAALNAHRQLLLTEVGMNKSMQKLSSGYRINNAGDDASGLVQANALRSDVRAAKVAAQNTIQGKASLAIHEGTANTIEGILERMKELLMKQEASGSTAEAATNSELAALQAEIGRIGTSVSAQTFEVGIDGSTITVEAFDMTETGVLGSGVTVTTATATSVIDAAIATIGGYLANIGAGMNRLEFTYANLQTQIENLSASESAIRDTDMAAEMVNFTKSQIMLQAGTAMLAQANMASQVVLSLFG